MGITIVPIAVGPHIYEIAAASKRNPTALGEMMQLPLGSTDDTTELDA